MIGAELRMSRQVNRLGLREWSDLPFMEEDFIKWLDLGLLKGSGHGNAPDIRRSFCVCGGPGPPHPRSPRGVEPPGWLAIPGQRLRFPFGFPRLLMSAIKRSVRGPILDRGLRRRVREGSVIRSRYRPCGGRWCNPTGCWTVVFGWAPLARILLIS